MRRANLTMRFEPALIQSWRKLPANPRLQRAEAPQRQPRAGSHVNRVVAYRRAPWSRECSRASPAGESFTTFCAPLPVSHLGAIGGHGHADKLARPSAKGTRLRPCDCRRPLRFPPSTTNIRELADATSAMGSLVANVRLGGRRRVEPDEQRR